MGLMERYQRKSIEAAQRALGDDVRVTDYAVATAGPHPLVVMGGIVVVVLAVLALTGLLVGGIAIILVGNAINKPRALVRTDRGFTLFKRSAFAGKPTDVLAKFDADALAAGVGTPQAGFVPVQLGDERVWVRAKDHARLAAGPGFAR
ncbi:MAG: hypothetical protein ACRDY7_16395 [Acidimicrobiia bacterium]